MESWGNSTTVTEFVLLGLSRNPQVRAGLFVIFLVMYLIAVAGNSLIVVLIVVDSHLHTPMYFFLSNLSFIDVCYVTTSVPQMLVHSFTERPTISYGRCFGQMSIAVCLAETEFLLLAVMAYDRLVAICNPLRYSLIMNGKVCIILALGLWTFPVLLTLVTFLTLQVNMCGHNVVNHFKCEVQAVLKLACSSTRINGIIMVLASSFTLLFPFIFILVTYGRIGFAVLRIRSAQGRGKALSTCGSHLAVVGIFYGTALAMYLRPQAKRFTNREKVMAIFYGVITPMLNPMIYSMRNREVKGALWRVIGRKVGK
ncbi:olfactory receptor 13H1-like [Tiliqua scincoides]|uniref:olfactory receptor 13H1-like n=1 Tax=Tiliqua scincoides TaxID=71010 RepID=UPI003462A39E